jgi:hypothetical protein
MKTYTVTLDKDGKLIRKNDGFTIIELMGLATMLQSDLMKIFEGTLNAEIKEVERIVVVDKETK